jgi:hypothetical protein
VGPVKQTGVEMFFQLAYLESDGRLRHVQAIRRFGKAEQTGNGVKYL